MPQVTLPYFNLLDESWVPVIMGDGERKRLCLLDVFHQADAVRAVEHPSPLVTAALHRVLLAVLYRALNPKMMNDVIEWFEGGWPLKVIVEYLEKWRDHFFLFHEIHPFWQIAEFDAKEEKSWSVLAAEHNASNSEGSKILFDHPYQWSEMNARPKDVACWLIAAQIFALPGGRGYSPAPASSALFVFSMGSNLRETLLLNLPYQKADITANDLPIWESGPETMSSLNSRPRRFPAGYANLYTWNSRAVHLYLEDDKTISNVGFKPGTGLDLDGENITIFHDPMLAYKDNELPIMPNQRGLWRDFDSLLPYHGTGNGDKSYAPLVIDHTAALCRKLATRPAELSVMVCGQVNEKKAKAKIEFWRMERFVLPAAILDESVDVRGMSRSLLEEAEKWQSRLYKACTLFAAECVKRNGNRKPDSSDIKKIVEQMPCLAIYWNHLERVFKLTLDNNFHSDAELALTMWRIEIRDAMVLAWKAQTEAVGESDAWTIRAMVKAGGIIGKAVRELNEFLNEK